MKNNICKMCNMEFTALGDLAEYQLFCDGMCFEAWLAEIEEDERLFHMYNDWVLKKDAIILAE